MITYFYFDSEIINCTSLQNEQTNEVLLEKWEKFGCLHICREDMEAIRSGLNDLGPKYSVKWKRALSDFTKKFVSIDEKKNISDYGCINQLEKVVGETEATTAMLPTVYREIYEQPIHENGVFEVVTPDHIHNSIHFKKSQDNSIKSLNSNEQLDVIWKNRIEKIAKISKSIVFIDKYMGLNILDDREKDRETSIEVFLKYLSKTVSHDTSITITIYCGCDIDGNKPCSEDLINYLKSLKEKVFFLNNMNLKLILTKGKYFSAECHDRLIAFDNFVMEIGKGADIFRPLSNKRNTFSIKLKRETFFKEVHSKLSKNRELIKII